MAKDTINVEDAIAMTPDFFGPLLPYVEDEDVTDIDYNGSDTWIRTCHGLRYKAKELTDKMTKQFVTRLTARIQTSVSKEFNPQHPLLEAETKTLRISIVHESVCNGRRSICIRKTPTSVRVNTRASVETGYASPELLSFLRNAVAAHFNVTICGEPGTGKTEFAKYLSMQIPDKERVITIEDNLEWHYHELKPSADCVEMQVSAQFSYFDAIKACLRQNPTWIMVSEVRGKEVANYLQQLTTGVHGITTLHTGDVANVPDRLCNMAADTSSRERTEGDIYTFLDLAVLVDMVMTDDGLLKRRVSQVGFFFTDENGKHKMLRIFDNGRLVKPDLPPDVMARFSRAHIDNPFINDKIVAQCEGLDLSSLDLVSHISSAPGSDNSLKQEPEEADRNALPPGVTEKRRARRFDTDIEASIKLGDKAYKKVIIKNVSQSGIGIISRETLDKDNLGFSFYASFKPEGIDKAILLECRAVRHQPIAGGVYYGCRIMRAGEKWGDYIDNLEKEF